MPMTQLEQQLLDALRRMDNRQVQRLNLLEQRIVELEQKQATLNQELQNAHLLVSDLEQLWAECVAISNR